MGLQARGCGKWWDVIARNIPYLALGAADFAAGAVNPLLAFIAGSEEHFADVSAAQAAAVAIGNIGSGWLAGRVSVRVILTAWLVLASISNALTPLAGSSLGLLLLCRIGANITDPWSLSQTLLDPRGASSSITGRAVAAVLAGRVVGGLLGGVVQHEFGTEAVCLLSGGLIAVAAILVAIFVPTKTADAQSLQIPVLEAEARGQTGLCFVAQSVEEEEGGEIEEGSRLLGVSAGHVQEGGEEEVIVVEEMVSIGVDTDPQVETKVWGLLWKLCGYRGWWFHVAILVVNGLVCGTLNTYVPSMLRHRFHVEPSTIQFVIAADMAVRSFCCSVLLPLASKVVKEPNLSAVIAAGLACMLIGTWFAATPLIAFIIVCSATYTVQSVHQSAALAWTNAYVGSRDPEIRGVVKGVAFCVFVGGIAVASYVAERIWSNPHLGEVALFPPLAFLSLLCAIVNRWSPIDLEKKDDESG